MSFDGIRKTDEPRVQEGMRAIRIAVGYTVGGDPVALVCDAYWNGIGLREKCGLEHYNEEDNEDEVPDNSDLIPVSHVQRLMFFMPAQAPAAKVMKTMDISGLMVTDQSPVDVQLIAPDAEESPKYAWD